MDDDRPELSAHALAALQEFYAEQVVQEEIDGKNDVMPSEDWNLSQFWYDDETANLLAEEAINVVGPNGSIACISCPTLFKKVLEKKPDGIKTVLLEYDPRFSSYGEMFVMYDYNKPLEVAREFSKAFDLVLADPPHLADECLTKMALTVRFMAKEKIVLCTGAVMAEMAQKLLGLKPCKFIPKHKNNLANEFKCYINYDSNLLNKES